MHLLCYKTVNVIFPCRLYPKQVRCGFQTQLTKLLKLLNPSAMKISLLSSLLIGEGFQEEWRVSHQHWH